MPLPGGASAKAGIECEFLWTVNCMLRAMQDETMSVRLEPPGEEARVSNSRLKRAKALNITRSSVN